MKINNFIKNNKLYVILFFLLFFIIGVLVFRDYGISWDETISRNNGAISYNYTVYGDKYLLNYTDRSYGVAFELPLYTLEKILNLQDSRDIFLMRHFLTFLVFFIGVIFFYKLCKEYFNDWKIGLLGSLFLILSPRIFANSFYNDKDLVFMSIFIIGIYSLIKWTEKKSYPRTFIHAIICAIIINIRMPGVIILAITIFIFSLESVFKYNKSQIKKDLIQLVLFILILTIFIIIFWPSLWASPLKNFILFFKKMSNYPWGGVNLYLGHYIKATNLPWHYIPVWILISTPILYSICFFIGLIVLIISFILNKWKNYSYQQKNKNIIFILWLFVPLASVIILKSTLYNSWRQMFFIYPAFLLISLIGILKFFEYIKNWRFLKILFIILISLSLLFTVFILWYIHPHQDVYFNILAGKGEKIRSNFELNYWGLSYKQGLEYILKSDNRTSIKIAVENYPGLQNAKILSPQDRARLQYVELKDADYFLTNYYDSHNKVYEYNEIHSIKVMNVKILGIYKLK